MITDVWGLNNATRLFRQKKLSKLQMKPTKAEITILLIAKVFSRFNCLCAFFKKNKIWRIRSCVCSSYLNILQ